ncbi:pyridoxal-phosphate dependent enzyme [Kitasatospora sp. NPDC048722]|uniref:pyridoxal-phosphate dependent enzyme n=1 Tax=Kitasatospora sp. NPDC048722 TaxID=3155639 RepID=UPI003401D930
MLFDSVVDAIGHTPLVRLRLDAPAGVEVFAKLECQNLFGMKDRVARNIILTAKRTGALSDGAAIVESSSGTMALGVALVGRALGHPVHIVTDPRIDEITLAKLRSLGCEVHIVEAMTGTGWQGARLELLAQLRAELPGAFWPDQYGNPDNPAGYRALAAELLDDLGGFDVLVGSVGSGGSLCGTARQLRTTLPELRVVGVDSVGSVLFGQPDRPGRKQSGLGNSLMPGNLDRRLIDEVHWLNDLEAFTATRDLARDQQIFAGNTSGSVYQLLRHLAARAAPGTKIVGILPDRGDRYTRTIYDDAYWTEHQVDRQVPATAPVTITPSQVAERWSRAEEIERSADRQRLLFVESNTTGTGMLALRLTRDLGLTPVLLTNSPERYPGVADTGCEVVTCDTNSAAALRETVRATWRREEIAGVATTSDFYLPAVAGLTTLLGLPGNSVESMAACRDKALTRARLAQAGVRQPRFAILADPAEVPEAVARIGLPCVVKPADDSGSNNVLLCSTTEQAVAQSRVILAETVNVRGQATAGTVLVEEYLDGPEFSVETFSWAGEVRCVGITQKHLGGPPHFVEHGHVFPAAVPPHVADDLTGAARRAVRAVGLTNGAAHTEVRLTPEGAAVIEVNGRLAGGMIPELVRLSTGINLLEEQVRAALGRPPRLDRAPTRAAAIRFLLVEREGTFSHVSGTEAAQAVEGIRHVTVTARPEQRVEPAKNAYHRLGYVIAEGETPDAAAELCAKAHDELTIVLRERNP